MRKNNFGRHSWYIFLAMNALLFVGIYLISMFAVRGYVSRNFYATADGELLQYMGEVKNKNLVEEIKKATSGNPDFSKLSTLNPTIPLVWYTQDATSGEFATMSADLFFQTRTPKLDKTKVGKYEDTKIGGYSYRTYTDTYKYGGAEGYIVLFKGIDIDEQVKETMLQTSMNLLWVFLALSLVESILMGYLQARPIAIANKENKSFMRDMAHELNTPLAVLKGNLELMIEDTNVAEDTRGNLLLMMGEVERMNRMSRELIEINLTPKKSFSKMPQIETKKVLEEMGELYSDYAELTKNKFSYECEAATVRINREDLLRIVGVLLDNAFKYAGEGATIKLESKTTRKVVQVIVRDTGVGVGDDEIDKIFTRFYRGASGLEKEKGTGLGLAIAKKLAKNYCGDITAMPNEPTGLVFTLSLKLSR